MSDQHEPMAQTRRELHRHDRHEHPLLRRFTWIAAGLVVVLVAITAFAVIKLNSNVNRVDVSKALGTDRPTPSTTPGTQGPLNILLMGSDTRSDLTTSDYGTDTIEGGAHSDTTILVHISAKRDRIMAVSIPRDSMLPGPKDCLANSPRTEWVVRQWNYNYNKGGAGCALCALEVITGVFINHYAVVNFEGFADMVDALDGVPVCTPIPIDDPASGLQLTAGRHVLDGRDALGYVRARKTIGDGSDLGRIKRQQAFMASVAQKATSTSLLLRPDKLFSFLSAATKALTTDPELGLTNMTAVAQSIQNVGTDNIEFITVPTEEYPPDHDRVQWTNTADLIWEAIKSDTAIGAPPEPSSSPSTTTDPSTSSTPSPSGTGSPSPSSTALTVSPDHILVSVLNGSGTPGVASQTAAALRAQGFNVTGLADAAITQGVTIEYASWRADSVKTVAAAFPGARLKLNEGVGDVIQVTVGIGAPFVVEVPNRLGTEPLPTPSVTPGANPSATPSIDTRTAADNICQ